METLSNLAFGLGVALSWQNVLYCFIGCFLGTLVGVLASSSVAPHVKSGRVRVLAVTMGKRSTLNPE